jgi:hypothetical protein
MSYVRTNWKALMLIQLSGSGLAAFIVYRRSGEGYALFCLLALPLPGSTTLLSMSRFVLVMPPLFLCAGALMGTSVWRFPLLMAMTGLLVWFTGRHAVWSFVA